MNLHSDLGSTSLSNGRKDYVSVHFSEALKLEFTFTSSRSFYSLERGEFVYDSVFLFEGLRTEQITEERA